MFWSLGSIWDLPKEANKAWWMQSGGIAGSGSIVKTDFEKSVGSRSLEGLFDIRVFQLIH